MTRQVDNGNTCLIERTCSIFSSIIPSIEFRTHPMGIETRLGFNDSSGGIMIHLTKHSFIDITSNQSVIKKVSCNLL